MYSAPACRGAHLKWVVAVEAKLFQLVLRWTTSARRGKDLVHVLASDERTIARMADLRGRGRPAHDSTTKSRFSSSSPEKREAIGEEDPEFSCKSAVFEKFEPSIAHHLF